VCTSLNGVGRNYTVNQRAIIRDVLDIRSLSLPASCQALPGAL
jgi:hypothetical protein